MARPGFTAMEETADPLRASVDLGDIALRLLAAILAGGLIGADRERRGKPLGVRTLALVALGAALVCVTTVHLRALNAEADAVSRVVQGVIEGVMTGVGFLGAGAVLQNPKSGMVEGLTTAATVWVTAALGIACALATWEVVGIGVALALIVLIVLNPLDMFLEKRKPRVDDEPKPVE